MTCSCKGHPTRCFNHPHDCGCTDEAKMTSDVTRYTDGGADGWMQSPTGEFVRYEDFAVVNDSHGWLYREKERLEKLSTQLQRDNSALISRLARYESSAEPPAPQWDINFIERIAREQGVFGGREGNTVTITGPIIVDCPAPNRSDPAVNICQGCKRPMSLCVCASLVNRTGDA